MFQKKKMTLDVLTVKGDNGFFYQLVNKFPELQDYLGDVFLCDLEFTSKYASRVVSKFTNIIADRFGIWEEDVFKELSLDGKNKLVEHILSINGYKWTKLISLLNKEYDPLKPFDISLDEHITDTLETEQDERTSTSADSVYGFNSVEDVPTDKSLDTSTAKYKRQNPRDRNYTRVGNIGNTSFQDLVKQEREVSDYKFKEIIFQDIVSTICRGEYL